MNARTIKILKVLTFFAGLVPLAFLAYKAEYDLLGANPIQEITHSTGKWTLIFLLVTLSITPLRRITGQPWFIRFRRMLGLFAFFYGSLHLLTYVVLDKFFDLHEMLQDIGKRRFITVGLAAFTLLVPLAVTSTSGMIRRLGGKRWRRLHYAIYLAAALAVIHFYWEVKLDTRRPIRYGFVLAMLLLWRVAVWALPKLKQQPAVRQASRAVVQRSADAACD